MILQHTGLVEVLSAAAVYLLDTSRAVSLSVVIVWVLRTMSAGKTMRAQKQADVLDTDSVLIQLMSMHMPPCPLLMGSSFIICRWIGNAAEDGKMGTVFARLKVPAPDGSGALDDHGVHAFIVPLRDEENQCFPGVEIKDCGYKVIPDHASPFTCFTMDYLLSFAW